MIPRFLFILPFLIIQMHAFSKESATLNSLVLNNHSLGFIENKGQVNSNYYYYLNDNNKSYFFGKNYIDILIKNTNSGRNKSSKIRLLFANANRSICPKADILNPTKVNYLKGKSSNWHVNIPSYNVVIYSNAWDGIDLIITKVNSNLKYDFIVHPFADPNQIGLIYEGAVELSINAKKQLCVATSSAFLVENRPYAYQMVNNKTHDIEMEYRLEAIGDDKLVKYDLGKYCKNITLVLDPEMAFCGYIGGTGKEKWGDIDVDMHGNVYVTGMTTSVDNNLNSLDAGYGYDIFVSKINASGSYLEYFTYIGGDQDDIYSKIAVDSLGNAYVLGATESTEHDAFPVLNGPDLTFNGGDYDGFILKLNSQGNGIIYCGYIGGANDDFVDSSLGSDLVVDKKNFVYITGTTYSNQNSLPVTVGPDLTYNGNGDAIIAKLDSSSLTYEYFGYIGGDSRDEGVAIALDSDKCPYITGLTSSTSNTFPVKNGPDLTFNGYIDSYIAKIASNGRGIVFCGYIGGDDRDGSRSISIDFSQNVYITGFTYSKEISFPVINGPDLTLSGDGPDAFAAKINASSFELDYCGYIGGTGFERSTGSCVDRDGCLYLTGDTSSDENSFPAANGTDSTYNGGLDAYYAKVSSDGSRLIFASYIGGSEDDESYGIVLDNLENLNIFGFTKSNQESFPVLIGPRLLHNSSWPFYYSDSFVAKIIQKGMVCDQYYIPLDGGTVTFNIDAGPLNADRTFLIMGALNAMNPGTPLPGNYLSLPFEVDLFSQSLLLLIDSPILQNFIGELDNNGRGRAKLKINKIRPDLVELKMFFACCLNDPFDYVSNPVVIEIVQ